MRKDDESSSFAWNCSECKIYTKKTSCKSDNFKASICIEMVSTVVKTIKENISEVM